MCVSVVVAVVVPELALGPAVGLDWAQKICCWQFVGGVGTDAYLLEFGHPLPFQKIHPADVVEKFGVGKVVGSADSWGFARGTPSSTLGSVFFCRS